MNSTDIEPWKAEDKVAAPAKEIRRQLKFHSTHEKRKTVTEQIYVTVDKLDREIFLTRLRC